MTARISTTIPLPEEPPVGSTATWTARSGPLAAVRHDNGWQGDIIYWTWDRIVASAMRGCRDLTVTTPPARPLPAHAGPHIRASGKTLNTRREEAKMDDKISEIVAAITKAWDDQPEGSIGESVAGVLTYAARRELATVAAKAVIGTTTEPEPRLRVGSRIRVVETDTYGHFAKGGEGIVVALDDTDAYVRRDGTKYSAFINSDKIELIDEDDPEVGDIVRVDEAVREDGLISDLPMVGSTYTVDDVYHDGDIAVFNDTEHGRVGYVVSGKRVTVIERTDTRD